MKDYEIITTDSAYDLELEEEDKYIKIESVKEQNKIEAELGVFWQQISEFLPQSKEREALGDGRIFKALKQAYLLFRPILLSKENNTIEEEVKEEYKGNISLANPNPEAVLKVKSLEDLEVGDEVIDEWGYIYQIKEKGFRLESITNHAVDIWRNLESIKEDFKLVKSLSPSEAETLLEEKLGIKVKIKN